MFRFVTDSCVWMRRRNAKLPYRAPISVLPAMTVNRCFPLASDRIR
jgi:hypothetical protein